MKETFSNYIKTSDNEQIFYQTNFDPKSDLKHEKVLVFNYGLVCSNYHWSYQLDYFDQLGYKILIHDYRGHFQSTHTQEISEITFEQISKDLNKIITELNIFRPILIGHSMGVNICLEYAKEHDKEIEKLILISGTMIPVHNIMMNTHLTGSVKPILQDLLKKHPKYVKNFWKYGGWNPLIRKLVHIGGFNKEHVSNEFIEIYLNKLGQLGPELFMQLISQMHEHDILAFSNLIKSKTLIIGGNKDKVIPNFSQRLINSKLKNSELYIIHEGSHVPQVDFPEIINERINYFLSS